MAELSISNAKSSLEIILQNNIFAKLDYKYTWWNLKLIVKDNGEFYDQEHVKCNIILL